MKDIEANEKFRFYTSFHIAEITGIKVSTIPELLKEMKKVNGSCIYHHTHRFLQQHQYLSPEPPNDFAYWVGEALGERRLGEELASVDTMQFNSIRELRSRLAEVLEKYLADNRSARVRKVKAGEEFHFIKTISFVAPTGLEAQSLKDFCKALENITIDSIYYHMFEAKLRLEKGENDFSKWLTDSLGLIEEARALSSLDPYTHTMEELRKNMLRILKTGAELQ